MGRKELKGGQNGAKNQCSSSTVASKVDSKPIAVSSTLRRLNPKASRKKTGNRRAMVRLPLRLSNFAKSFKNCKALSDELNTKDNCRKGQKKILPKKNRQSNQKKKKSTGVTKIAAKMTAAATSVPSSAANKMGDNQIISKKEAKKPDEAEIVSSTTTSLFAVISTSTTSVSNSSQHKQVSIAMYQREENVLSLDNDGERPAAGTQSVKSRQICLRNSCHVNEQLEHINESIERVVSGHSGIGSIKSNKVVQVTKRVSQSVAKKRCKSTEKDASPTKGKKKKKKTDQPRSIHLRSRSVKTTAPPSTSLTGRSRPKRKRLACLNAIAKVHCLYENDFRNIPSAHFDSDSDSDTCSEDSSEDSSTTSNSCSSDGRSSRRSRRNSSNNSRSSSSSSGGSSSSRSSSSSNSDSSQSESGKGKNTKTNSADTGSGFGSRTKWKNKKKNSITSKGKKWNLRHKVKTPKKRRSMEVPVMELTDFVVPKRIASLNATAILAASSQHWSGKSKRRNGKSESDFDSPCQDTNDEGSPPPVTVKTKKMIAKHWEKKEGKPQEKSSPSRREPGPSSSEKEGNKTSGDALRLSTIQTDIRCSLECDRQTYVVSTSSTSHAYHVTNNGVVRPTDTAYPATGNSYSPLGALYNMRPPNAQQSAISGQGNGKSEDKTWLKDKSHLSERLIKDNGMSTPLHVNFETSPIVVGKPATSTTPHRPESSERSTSPVESVRSTFPTPFPASFTLYRPPHLLSDRPIVDPYSPYYSASPYSALDAAQYSPYYRGFTLLPPPGSGFVPVAFTDSYAGYAVAPPPPPPPPPPLAPTPNQDLSYYFHRYPTPTSCYPLNRYLPPPSCLAEWRRREPATASGVLTMHGDRNPLPLAASEAAAAKSEPGGGLSHPLLLTSAPPFCGFPPPPVAPAYADRCLGTGCACAASQSSSSCPKNVQAGPLTGEGKRSGPNLPSQTVIPHPSSFVSQPGIGATSSPAVPCLPPELQATAPLETAADPEPQDTRCHLEEKNRCMNIRRRKKYQTENFLYKQEVGNLVGQESQSPVSSRLRSRGNSGPIGSTVFKMDRIPSPSCYTFLTSDANRNKVVSECAVLDDCIPAVYRQSKSCNGQETLKSEDVDHENHFTFIIDSKKRNDNTRDCNDHGDHITRQELGSDMLRALNKNMTSKKRKRKQLDNSHDQLVEIGKQLSLIQKATNKQSLRKCDLSGKHVAALKSRRKKSSHEEDKCSEVCNPVCTKTTEVKRNSLIVDGTTGDGGEPNIKKRRSDFRNVGKLERNVIRNKVAAKVKDDARMDRKLPENESKIIPKPKEDQKNPDKCGSKGACKARSPLPGLTSSPRWSNGWSWEGPSFQSAVQLRNDEASVMLKCYSAMRHSQGDIVRVRDCLLLRSGTKAKDLPFVAKVSALWENAQDGEMMMSLLWYYRPEHTEGGRRKCDLEDEIFASRHRDICSVACIEDKCYVLTFNEYCRYRKQVKMTEQGICQPAISLVPRDETVDYPRRLRLPGVCVAPDRVFLCRKVYDFRQKRILKNPNLIQNTK